MQILVILLLPLHPCLCSPSYLSIFSSNAGPESVSQPKHTLIHTNTHENISSLDIYWESITCVHSFKDGCFLSCFVFSCFGLNCLVGKCSCPFPIPLLNSSHLFLYLCVFVCAIELLQGATCTWSRVVFSPRIPTYATCE